MRRIHVSGPSITQKEIDYVTDAVKRAWYGNANVFHERFEKAFASFLGVEHAVALPSCTSALHLALLSLGIGPGDEVVVPDVTWIATAAPISYVGATPVFADVDPKSWCISAAALQACITDRTRAVISVDLYGNMPDYVALRAVADHHGIAVIEDAAEAIGATYRSAPAGTHGDIGVFSFHGSKTMTTGEGGMLVCDRDDIAARVRYLRDHGRSPGPRMFFNTAVAHKYKMSAMQAALGLAQLERIDELVGHKRRIFGWYAQDLADEPGVELNAPLPDVEASYWMVTALVDGGPEKETLIERLGRQGVDCRPFFYPLSSLPAYGGSVQALRARERNRVAYALSPRGINLPCGMDMDAETVAYVCRLLRGVLAEHRAARAA